MEAIVKYFFAALILTPVGMNVNAVGIHSKYGKTGKITRAFGKKEGCLKAVREQEDETDLNTAGLA